MKLISFLLPAALLLGEATTSATGLIPFEGAQWIAADSSELPLYADYLPVFLLGFDVDVPPGSSVSVLFGLDDPRLMNRNMNIYGLENRKGESYIRFEIETAKSGGMSASGDSVSSAAASGSPAPRDSIRIYRAGYHPSDNASRPLKSFPVDNLTHKGDKIEIAENLGHTEIFVNGEKVGYVAINPVGNGGDYLAFPVLGGLGVNIPENSKARISEVTVSNFREPRNEIARLEGPFTTSASFRFPERSMPEMRTAIDINPEKQVAKATVNATAMGIYDLYINGKRVHDDYFLPGSTQYNKTHLYHTFDITPLLHSGSNPVGVQLSEGWWSGPATFVGENWNFYGDRQAFLAEITVEYTDGSSDRFVTDPAKWEYSVDGPLVVGSFFQGEIFDASRRDSGSRTWHKAVSPDMEEIRFPFPGGWNDAGLRPSYGDRVLPVDTVTAVSMCEPRQGVWVYDMGQNMAAIPCIGFTRLPKGREITIRHGEVLYPDMPQYEPNIGMVMTENLRAAMCADKYIASGEPHETFSPRHTLHGYRFLEITGLDEPLPLSAVRSIPVSSVSGFKAHFECSDSLVNRLWENIKWSTQSNFISIPTDCPQRNERLGWMGDISVFAPTATKIADLQPLLRQYLQTVRDCQEENGRFPDVAPTGFGFGGFLWGSAGITVPWEYYRQYGDTVVLREHYPAMKRYIDYVMRETIEPSTDLLVQNRAWGDLGDWLSPEYDKTDKSLLWECYLIYDLEIMRDVARLLGLEEDADEYSGLAEKRKQFFAATYVDLDTEKTRWSAFDANKQGAPVDTQSSYALPLAMGIYDTPRFRDNFMASIERENLADDGTVCPPYSLMTGFIGTAWVLHALSAIDRDDAAYRLLTSEAYPSWLYPVTQGATTVWERLNSYTHKDGFGKNNSMNSFNHYSFGSVGDWLLTHCLGIKISPAGEVTVNPTPDPTGRIKFARGWIDTPSGRIESSWGEELQP